VTRWAAAALAAGLLVSAAAAQAVDESGFRYERALEAPPGLASFEPDGPLYAHSKEGLTDLRILDSAGAQVPWRTPPPPSLQQPPRMVRLLNSGTRGGRAVTLVDLGADPGIHDRLMLDIPDSDFVGRVDVRGSDQRDGPFTFLSSTGIYDISGAPPARSTTAVYPQSDFRYLSLSATDVSAITGVFVPASGAPSPELLQRELESFQVSSEGGDTVATADLGFPNMPVDELRIRATTKLYDRPVQIEGSNTGENWVLLAQGRVFRFQNSVETTIPLTARHRYLRLTIENGDDPPLDDLRVEALARPRTILVSDGFRPPYRLLYGNPSLLAPQYDFAEAPIDSIDADSAAEATLGAEELNPSWEPPEDTRSFSARHPVVIPAVLAVAAVVLFFGAFLALRRRTEKPSDV
jgi:Protein of unknown function (DUF3999)